MSIFSRMFRSRDKPDVNDSTAGSSYRFFFGGSAAGKPVNERTSMQVTAVYCCVRILSEAVASLPLHLYRYTSDGSKEKAVEHPLYFLLHNEPIDEACRKYRNNLISDTTPKILHAYEEGGEDQVIAVVHAVQDKNKITNEYIRDDKSPDRSGLSMVERMLNEAKQRIAEESGERDGSSNPEPPRQFSLHDKHGKEYIYDRVKNTIEMENPNGEIIIDSLYEWLRSPMFPRELLPQIKEIREKYPPVFSMKTFAEGLEEELYKERGQSLEKVHEGNGPEKDIQKVDDMEL